MWHCMCRILYLNAESTSAWLCVHACVCVHIRMHVCIKWFQSFKPVMQGNQNHRAWFALWFGENHIFWELLPPAYQTQAFQTRLNLLRNVVKKTLSHDGYLQFAYVYTEGQNHRMVWVGGDWKGRLITAPCHGMLLSTVSVVASQWSSRQQKLSWSLSPISTRDPKLVLDFAGSSVRFG